MVNPDDERATINVKGVAARAWERAKTAALKQDETMGVWLSRAIDYRADAEAGPREFPPANPAANPEPKTVKPEAVMAAEQLADLMRGMAAWQPRPASRRRKQISAESTCWRMTWCATRAAIGPDQGG